MKRETFSDCFNILALGALFLAAVLSGCAVEDRPYDGDREIRASRPERRADAPVQKGRPAPKPARLGR
jgi:hypothetical protein